jgi:hypothetical protein
MFIEFLKEYGPDSAKVKLNNEYVNICYLIWCTIVAVLSIIGKCFMCVPVFVIFILMIYAMIVAPALSICHYFIPDLFMFQNKDDVYLGVIALFMYSLAAIVYILVNGVKYISKTDIFNKIKNALCFKIKIGN